MYQLSDRIKADTTGDADTRADETESVKMMIRKIESKLPPTTQRIPKEQPDRPGYTKKRSSRAVSRLADARRVNRPERRPPAESEKPDHRGFVHGAGYVAVSNFSQSSRRGQRTQREPVSNSARRTVVSKSKTISLPNCPIYLVYAFICR